MVCKRGPPLQSHLFQAFPIPLHNCGCSSRTSNVLCPRDSLGLPRVQANTPVLLSFPREAPSYIPPPPKKKSRTQKSKQGFLEMKVLTGIKGNQTYCHSWRKASPSWEREEAPSRRRASGGQKGPVSEELIWGNWKEPGGLNKVPVFFHRHL